MNILTVIPLKKTHFSEELSYFSMSKVSVGSIVKVKLRNQNILALVIDVKNASQVKSEVKNLDFKIKKIESIKEISIFQNTYIESILRVSEYFVSNKSFVASYLIPSIIKENYDEVSKVYKDTETKEEKNIKAEKLLFQTNIENRIDYYKTLIRSNFANKKSIFIVLPTENDVLYFEENLKKGIEDFVFALYSSISNKKLLEKIKKTINENHPIVIIATPPYLALARNDIDTIILEKENSNAYNTVSNPYIDLRVFVETYAFLNNTKLILASDLLRFETLAKKEFEHISEVSNLSYRMFDNFNIEILERNKKEDGTFKIFNDETIEKIKDQISKNKKVFIFSLRKGLATYTVCRNCYEEIVCDNCAMPLVLYKSHKTDKRIFACNKCKTEKDPLIKCNNCGSWDLVPLGIGSSTIYEELKEHIDKNQILILDKEHVKNNKEALNIISEFKKPNRNILIGTEMVFNYDFEKVDLSIIASFDTLFTIPNYKINEKILNIILNTTSKTKQNLIIETKNKNSEILEDIKNRNLLEFVRKELKLRKDFDYPPYKKFIKISKIDAKEEILKMKNALGDYFQNYNPIIFNGYIKDKSNKYILNILIKLNKNDWLEPYLEKNIIRNKDLNHKLTTLPKDFSISIDPSDLV